MKISLIGDIALNGLFSTQPRLNFIRLTSVSQILQDSDFVFANLEIPIKAGDKSNKHKSIPLSANESATLQMLNFLNVSCVSLANNHIYDWNMPGLQATIKLLDKLRIYHTGAGWLSEHIEPVIINNYNLSLGFLAYVDPSTNPKTEYFPELLINYLDLDKVVADIRKLRNNVDKIILNLHWGVDYSNFYTQTQKNIAHALVDAGADIIMGNHPHTIQSYEVYKKKYIFYSLGQLCYGDFIRAGNLRAINRKTKKGMIINIERLDPMIIKIIPTLEKRGNDIVLLKNNIERKLSCYSFINDLYLKYRLIEVLVSFKEVFVDRFIEYFFGYYQKPIKDFFFLKTWKKGFRILKANKN